MHVCIHGSCVSDVIHVTFVLAGSELVKRSIQAMIDGQCEEVVLEAEVGNTGALKLYQGLGFVRDKRLHRYVRLDTGIPNTYVCVDVYHTYEM